MTVTGGPPPGQQSDPLLSEETKENVDALLETVRDLLKAEEARDQSFNARGVGLAGFVGIIVSLSTTVGRDALSANLAAPWEGIAVALFGAALIFLLSTVIMVVEGVLRPRESAHLGYEDVERYALPEYVFRPKVLNQGSTMRGLIDVLAIERRRATAKSQWLHRGYRSLLLGLACIATLGFILALHDAELMGSSSMTDPNNDPQSNPPASEPRPSPEPMPAPSPFERPSIDWGQKGLESPGEKR